MPPINPPTESPSSSSSSVQSQFPTIGGATARDVMNLVLRQSVSMVAVGVVIGAGAAWGAGRLLARVVDGMRPTDPSTAAVMTSVLVAAAMVASVVPARRASRVDVLEALRQD
jgi:putative ABC transport system permease protein